MKTTQAARSSATYMRKRSIGQKFMILHYRSKKFGSWRASCNCTVEQIVTSKILSSNVMSLLSRIRNWLDNEGKNETIDSNFCQEIVCVTNFKESEKKYIFFVKMPLVEIFPL